MPDLKIGALARSTGTSAPTIRYYEAIGLLPRPARRGGGQRSYGDSDVARLTFIRRCRAFGFAIDQVRTLVALVDDRKSDCTQARDIAQRHLDAVRAKQAELRALERSIAAFVLSCEQACIGGAGPDCAIIEDLAAPRAKARTARGCA